MRTPDQTEVRPSALDALLSTLIILAKPAAQQAITLLVIMTFILSEVMLQWN